MTPAQEELCATLRERVRADVRAIIQGKPMPELPRRRMKAVGRQAQIMEAAMARGKRAYEMRQSRKPWKEIGRALGYTAVGALTAARRYERTISAK